MGSRFPQIVEDGLGRTISDISGYDDIPVEYSEQDKEIIRRLASEYMDYASLPVQKETIRGWEKVNDLERARPMLWHTELPWHELNVNDELTLQTGTQFAQRMELELRRQIYLWKHMPADMVLQPVFGSPMVIHNTGIGLDSNEDTVATDEANDIVGHRYITQIRSEEDLEKIKMPVITLDAEKTRKRFEAMQNILDGIMPVEIKGVRGFWFEPIDYLSRAMGLNDFLMNLFDEPELVHAGMKKICDAYLAGLDQYEKLGCIGTNNQNSRVGSGAYGYSAALPRGSASGMKCSQMWGASVSQLFTSVSPAMQEEFALQYEKPWLERFAYTYYGCCERLDHKIDVLRKIPNLRKISCSPWSDTAHMAEVVGRDYVLSLKPTPAMLAFETFDEEAVRRDLRGKLNDLRGCNVEVIIKDVSTVRYQPERLWRWVEIAHQICREM